MASQFNRKLEHLRAVDRSEVLSAGIHSIEELPQFRPTIEANFSGEKREVLEQVADAVERGKGVPENAIDPGIRAREPEPGNPESVRKRLAGEAGTPSDEYAFKTEENSLSTDFYSSTQPQTREEDDAIILEAGEADGLLAPEQVYVTGERLEKAKEYNQEERSARERSVDEEFDAPVTTDLERWQENPNRLDFPGVDTVPQRNRQQRAAEFAAQAQERGVVDRFEIGTGVFGDKRHGVKGNASGNRVKVSTSRALDASQVLAHEIGHKVEERMLEQRQGGTVREFGLLDEFDDEAKQDARTLSTQLRGDPAGDTYREKPGELFADAVAATALSPRRAKRDAPAFVETLEEELPEEQREIFPF